MALEASSELVTFDAEAALARAREWTDDGVLVCGEFTAHDYKVLYVADRLADHYDDRAALLDRGAEVHDYESLDFFEREAFADMLGAVGEVRGFATFTDVATVLRVVTAEEGLYLSVDPGADATGLLEAVEPIVAGEDRANPL